MSIKKFKFPKGVLNKRQAKKFDNHWRQVVKDFKKAIESCVEALNRKVDNMPLIPWSDEPIPVITEVVKDIYAENKEKMDEISAKIDKHFEDGTVPELIDEIAEQFEKRKDENFNVSGHVNVTVDWTPATGEQIKEDFINCVKGFTNE